jgi:hypothetical protein
MRLGWPRLLFLLVLLATGVAWLVSGPLGVEGRIVSLANQPEVRTAFLDPESGRSDAMIALVSFAVLGPIVVGVLLLLVLLVMKAVETALVTVKLPGWLSTPLVLAGGGYGVYTTSESWLPQWLYAFGIVSRAYLVYSHGTVPIIR